MRMIRKSAIFGLIAMVFIAVSGQSCDGTPSSQERGAKTQESLMKRAQAAHPVPKVNNFRTREAVVKWMERMDVPDKVFYVYLLGNNGQKIGYYVANTRPVSVCTFLTPPEREVPVRGQGSHPLGTAPALDGVWYKGGGCDQHFFFDAVTDAMHSIKGIKYIVSDQPLSIEADPLGVTTIEDVSDQ